MRAGALVRAELRERRRMLAALSVGVFAFLLALGSTYQAIGGPAGLTDTFGGRTPAFFSAFAGESGVNVFAPSNYLAFGFVHPLFLVLTLTVGMSIGSAAVAGDVETGRAEMLYVHPLARTAIIDARLVLWAGAQVAVVAIALLGAFAGSRLSDDLRRVAFTSELRVVLQYLPLATLFGAVAFVASAVSRTRGQALGAAIGAAALAYLVNFVALLWHPIAFARRLTPFGYYSPTRAAQGFVWGHALLLSAVTVVLVLIARVAVDRRDLV